MKIDRPKFHQSSKEFSRYFYEEDPTLEVCEIIDSLSKMNL